MCLHQQLMCSEAQSQDRTGKRMVNMLYLINAGEGF